jgi:general secretion pathway protein H
LLRTGSARDLIPIRLRSLASRPRWRSLGTPARHRAGGFTLLEILVVVLIIGIMATLALLAIGNRSLDDRLHAEARRLHELMRLAADEAVLQGVELGFVQTPDGYGFLVLSGGRWQPLEGAGPLRPRPLAQPLFLELQVDGRPVAPLRLDDERQEPRPQVLLLSSGDATEFTLDLRAPQFAPFYRLQGDVLGQLKLERKEGA